MNLDEWKVMALAAFGAPDGPEYKRMRDLVELRDNGWVDVDLHCALLNGARAEPQTHNYYGPAFSNDEIEAVLKRAKLRASFVEDLERHTAVELANGRLVGWFHGAMEFGQRALGNRSILADPRRAESRDIVNAAVKFRESFGPFAPAVLADDFIEARSGPRPCVPPPTPASTLCSPSSNASQGSVCCSTPRSTSTTSRSCARLRTHFAPSTPPAWTYSSSATGC
jgi:predicted NodU family carbamoyl transferase